jgi:Transketolase, C-terminal subunit
MQNLEQLTIQWKEIAVLRTLPNMNIVCPSDPVEVELAFKEALRIKKPPYIRL